MMRQTNRTTKTGMAFAALLGLASTGCSICPSPYDLDYSAFGTATPRADMRCGRVGSIFSDPNASGSMVAPSETIVEPAPETVSPASYNSASPSHVSQNRNRQTSDGRRVAPAPKRRVSAWQSPESAELIREASSRGEMIVGEVIVEDVVIDSSEFEGQPIDGVEIGDIGPQ